MSGPLLTLDAGLSRVLVRTVPDEVTQRLSDLGNVPVAVPVLVFAVVYAARRGNRLGAAAAALAMALVPALVVPLKDWTGRPGPWSPGPPATTPRATRRPPSWPTRPRPSS